MDAIPAATMKGTASILLRETFVFQQSIQYFYLTRVKKLWGYNFYLDQWRLCEEDDEEDIDDGIPHRSTQIMK